MYDAQVYVHALQHFHSCPALNCFPHRTFLAASTKYRGSGIGIVYILDLHKVFHNNLEPWSILFASSLVVWKSQETLSCCLGAVRGQWLIPCLVLIWHSCLVPPILTLFSHSYHKTIRYKWPFKPQTLGAPAAPHNLLRVWALRLPFKI